MEQEKGRMAFLAIPAGCQMLRTERWFWHPAGVRPLTVPEPGGIAPLDPRLPSGIPPGCPSPTSPPLIYSTGNSEELRGNDAGRCRRGKWVRGGPRGSSDGRSRRGIGLTRAGAWQRFHPTGSPLSIVRTAPFLMVPGITRRQRSGDG